jgi:hypothetical protein
MERSPCVYAGALRPLLARTRTACLLCKQYLRVAARASAAPSRFRLGVWPGRLGINELLHAAVGRPAPLPPTGIRVISFQLEARVCAPMYQACQDSDSGSLAARHTHWHAATPRHRDWQFRVDSDSDPGPRLVSYPNQCLPVTVHIRTFKLCWHESIRRPSDY